MSAEIIPLTRSPTVTITREQFRGLCDARKQIVTCHEHMQLIRMSGKKHSRAAAKELAVLLDEIDRQLRDATGD